MMCFGNARRFFGIYRFRRRRDAFADESVEGHRGNCAQRRFVFDRCVRDFAWAQKFKGLVDACKHFRNAVGFLGGVYLPMGFLPKGVASVLKFLPFLHGASILRKSCVQAALDKTLRLTGCPSEIATNYQENVGITVKAGGHVLSTAAQVGIMTLWLVAALAAVFAISRRKHLNG